jgi:hypothetical protein
VPTLNSAAPVLASLDIERTVSFYCSRLGFTRVYVDPGVWGIVTRDSVQIHFWPCSDKNVAENTSCRVYVSGIDALSSEFEASGVNIRHRRSQSVSFLRQVARRTSWTPSSAIR